MARGPTQIARARAASIPLACEVCREGLVTTLITDFIFVCDPCAKRISTALGRGRQAGDHRSYEIREGRQPKNH